MGAGKKAGENKRSGLTCDSESRRCTRLALRGKEELGTAAPPSVPSTCPAAHSHLDEAALSLPAHP